MLWVKVFRVKRIRNSSATIMQIKRIQTIRHIGQTKIIVLINSIPTIALITVVEKENRIGYD